MGNCRNYCNRFYIFIAFFCAFSCLALGVLTFLYADWVQYGLSATVRKSPYTIQFFSRRSGIFWEVLYNDEDKTLFNNSGHGNKDQYDVDRLGRVDSKDANYIYLINLRIARLALHVCGFGLMAIICLTLLGALIFWCKYKHDEKCIIITRFVCGFLALLSAICYIISIILFHVMDDKEKYIKTTDLPYTYSQWTDTIINDVKINYGSMYYVTWGCVFLALLVCVILLSSTVCCRRFSHSEYSGRNPKSTLYNAPPTDAYYMSERPANGANRPMADDHQSHASGVSGHRLPRQNVEGHDNHSYYGSGPLVANTTPPVYSPPGNKSVYRIY